MKFPMMGTTETTLRCEVAVSRPAHRGKAEVDVVTLRCALVRDEEGLLIAAALAIIFPIVSLVAFLSPVP